MLELQRRKKSGEELPAPPPESSLDRIVGALQLLSDRVIGWEGRKPNFMVREVDVPILVAGGETGRRLLSCDWVPDRWVVWMRHVDQATTTLRAFPGDAVPTEGAIEIADHQVAVVSVNPGVRNLAIQNTGSASAHVFAVAVGGGAEFEIRYI